LKRNPSLLEGLLIALLAALLVTGAVILAGYEKFTFGQQPSPLPPSQVPESTEAPTELQPLVEETEVPEETSSPTVCPQPEGWLPYEMKTGDSLELLAG